MSGARVSMQSGAVPLSRAIPLVGILFYSGVKLSILLGGSAFDMHARESLCARVCHCKEELSCALQERTHGNFWCASETQVIYVCTSRARIARARKLNFISGCNF